MTINSLQKYNHYSSGSQPYNKNSNNTTTSYYNDDRWTSLEMDDESSHAFDSRHPLSKAMSHATKNFQRVNINNHVSNTNGTGAKSNPTTTGNVNREMINLDSIDNDDEKSESVISSNKNSNDSTSAAAAAAATPSQPPRSIFVRLNSKNNGESSVQSAPNGISIINDPASGSYKSGVSVSSSPASHSQAGAGRTGLKSSKSVPKQIYSSASQNGLANKSHSTTGSNGKEQYSKLCSIL